MLRNVCRVHVVYMFDTWGILWVFCLILILLLSDVIMDGVFALSSSPSVWGQGTDWRRDPGGERRAFRMVPSGNVSSLLPKMAIESSEFSHEHGDSLHGHSKLHQRWLIFPLRYVSNYQRESRRLHPWYQTHLQKDLIGMGLHEITRCHSVSHVFTTWSWCASLTGATLTEELWLWIFSSQLDSLPWFVDVCDSVYHPSTFLSFFRRNFQTLCLELKRQHAWHSARQKCQPEIDECGSQKAACGECSILWTCSNSCEQLLDLNHHMDIMCT